MESHALVGHALADVSRIPPCRSGWATGFPRSCAWTWGRTGCSVLPNNTLTLRDLTIANAGGAVVNS